MKKIIEDIDSALKQLYRLDTEEKAQDFIVASQAQAPHSQGSLLVQQQAADTVSVGIYLAPEIQHLLSTIQENFPKDWQGQELNAFSVASEEVSHFHYLLHRAKKGESVSQIELETQGEVDKFFLCFFTATSHNTRRQDVFEFLFEKLFVRHKYAENLSADAKARYSEANQLARDFVHSTRDTLEDKTSSKTLKKLRGFYDLPRHEKLSVRLRR